MVTWLISPKILSLFLNFRLSPKGATGRLMPVPLIFRLLFTCCWSSPGTKVILQANLSINISIVKLSKPHWDCHLNWLFITWASGTMPFFAFVLIISDQNCSVLKWKKDAALLYDLSWIIWSVWIIWSYLGLGLGL